MKDDARTLLRIAADGRLRYSEYKGGGPNSAWDKGLTEPELTEWVLSQCLP
jgi:hypothetical protein